MVEQVSWGIPDITKEHGISEVVHFTSNYGFVGCLSSGLLLSRRRLPQEKTLQHVLKQTSPIIFEEKDWFNKEEDWLNYVNMSVSEINSSYFRFANEKWHTTGDRYWVVMAFDSVIMEHEGVYFSTTNNVYPPAKRSRGPAGLDALFSMTVEKKTAAWVARRGARTPKHLTTCEQAEVLYPEAVSMEYLRSVYVQFDEHADWAKMILKRFKREEVPVIAGMEKFRGQPNR